MDVGIVTAKIDEVGYIARAENLGYSHAWVTDSPMVRSNCTIRLGTGVNAELINATCLSGAPDELAEKLRALERAGLRQIMLYPPLNRQYRVIEDFADKVMARL